MPTGDSSGRSNGAGRKILLGRGLLQQALTQPAPVRRPGYKDPCPNGFVNVVVDGYTECLHESTLQCPPGQLGARYEYDGQEKCFPDPAASPHPVPTKSSDPCPAGWVNAVVGTTVKCVVRGMMPCPQGKVSAWMLDGAYCLPDPMVTDLPQPQPEAQPKPQPEPKPQPKPVPVSAVQPPKYKDPCPAGFVNVVVDGFTECLYRSFMRCPVGQLSARSDLRGPEKCYPDPANSPVPVPSKHADPCPSGWVNAVVGGTVKCVVKGAMPCPPGRVSAWLLDGADCLPVPAAQAGEVEQANLAAIENRVNPPLILD